MDRLETLLSFYREDPDDAFTAFAIASEYRKRGDNEKALEFFEQLETEHPEYIGTYYHLGKLYQEIGRPDDALDVYRRGIAVTTDSRDFHARSELQSALMELEMGGFD